MKKIKVLAELWYEESIINEQDPEEIEYYYGLLYNDRLTIISEEIGDELGQLKILKILGSGG